MKYIILLLSISLNLYALEFNESSTKGLKISPVYQESDNSALQSNGQYVFEGEICAVKAQKNGKAPKCYEFDGDDIVVKAYFPDMTTEVTDQLQVTKLEKFIKR